MSVVNGFGMFFYGMSCFIIGMIIVYIIIKDLK